MDVNKGGEKTVAHPTKESTKNCSTQIRNVTVEFTRSTTSTSSTATPLYTEVLKS